MRYEHRDELELPDAMRMIGVLVHKLGDQVEVTLKDFEDVAGFCMVSMNQLDQEGRIVLKLLPRDHPLNPRLL